MPPVGPALSRTKKPDDSADPGPRSGGSPGGWRHVPELQLDEGLGVFCDRVRRPAHLVIGIADDLGTARAGQLLDEHGLAEHVGLHLGGLEPAHADTGQRQRLAGVIDDDEPDRTFKKVGRIDRIGGIDGIGGLVAGEHSSGHDPAVGERGQGVGDLHCLAHRGDQLQRALRHIELGLGLTVDEEIGRDHLVQVEFFDATAAHVHRFYEDQHGRGAADGADIAYRVTRPQRLGTTGQLVRGTCHGAGLVGVPHGRRARDRADLSQNLRQVALEARPGRDDRVAESGIS